MPTLPPVGEAPYTTVNAVLNTARVRVNDAMKALTGDILTNDQPFTQNMFNNAWQRFQAELASLGSLRLVREVILTNLPVVANTDPSTQVHINWASYWDGNADYPAPVLPQDMILPLKCWERWSGTQSDFAPMENWIDGLPTRAHQARNVFWEWRDDSLYMPGATRILDMRIRYAAYFADIISANNIPWYEQPVPILRSKSSLAWYVCAEFSGPRGDLDTATFEAKALNELKLLNNVEIRQKQRVNMRRIPRNAGSRSGRGRDGY